MYIFTRTATIDMGRTADAFGGATELSKKVTELTDLQVTTWYQQFAPTGPAVVWTARMEHLDEMDRAFETLMASNDYQDAVAELDEFFTPPMVDNVIEIVAGSLPTTALPVVSGVWATATNGHLRAAMHWGADLAERFERSMDVPTLFGRGLYGSYGTMVWASYFEDVVALEGTQAKLAGDEMLQAVMDEGAHNCQDGAISVVMRKLD